MKRAFLVLVGLAVIAGLGAGAVLYKRTTEPYKGYGEAERLVLIEPGSSTRAIAQQLIDAGVVRDDVTFRAALWRTGRARSLQAGEFRFERPMTPVEVVEMIARGDVYTRRITFPEGLNVREMGRIFEQQRFGTAAMFVDAARDVTGVRDLDSSASDLEGYLFPETYAMPRNTTAARLVEMMVGRFRQLFTAEMQQAALALGLTPRQAVTLASLVEKETAKPSERPIVAAVYLNRLKIGMGMQADPTVIYALQRAGRYDGNLRRDDLAFDSPYNTYRYLGAAARTDRVAGAGVAPGCSRASRGGLSLFCQPQRRVTRVRAHPRGAQRERAAISGGVFPGAARGRAGRGEGEGQGPASLAKADVGLAGPKQSWRSGRGDPASRANPAVELQPMLERAPPP